MRAVTDLENSNLNPAAVQAVADDLFTHDPLAAHRLRDVAALWAAAEEVELGVPAEEIALIMVDRPLDVRCHRAALWPAGAAAPGRAEVVLLDFKTDSPHGGPLATSYPVYAAQLRLYEQALRGSGWLADQRLRSGLLFTATGELGLWSLVGGL